MRKTTYLPPRGNVVSTPRLQILICIVLFLPFWSAAPTRGPSASREGPIVGLAPEVKIKGVIKLLSIIVNQVRFFLSYSKRAQLGLVPWA